MRLRRPRKAPSNEFSRLLQRILRARELNNTDLRDRLEVRGKPFTKQFVCMLCNGQRDPPAELIALVADALDLTEEWALKLHRAAAIDQGYAIGGVE